jgi:hypothetical protein
VTEGIEVVDEIASAATDYSDRPKMDVRIKRVTLENEPAFEAPQKA